MACKIVLFFVCTRHKILTFLILAVAVQLPHRIHRRYSVLWTPVLLWTYLWPVSMSLKTEVLNLTLHSSTVKLVAMMKREDTFFRRSTVARGLFFTRFGSSDFESQDFCWRNSHGLAFVGFGSCSQKFL